MNDDSEMPQLERGHPGFVVTWSQRVCRRVTTHSAACCCCCLDQSYRQRDCPQLVHSQIASRIPSAKCHSWNGDTLETSSGRGLDKFPGDDHSRRHTGEHRAAWCWFSDQPCRRGDCPQPVHVTGECGHPLKCLFDEVSESFLEVIPVSRTRCSLLLRLGSVVSLARLSCPLRTCRRGVCALFFPLPCRIDCGNHAEGPCPPR